MTELNYTIDELICTCIARQIENYDVVAQGINTPLVMAGIILAKLTHAPDIRISSAIGQSICQDWGQIGVGLMEKVWLERSLFSVGFATASIDLLPQYNPKEFFRPAQVDIHGNTNNIAIGKDYHKPRMRLPGTGGIPDVTPYSNHTYLYVPRHSRITFVERLDFKSGLGHSPERIRGEGPRYLVSDLAQFDWNEGKMRLISIHENATLERIISKTGFEFETVENLDQTPPPTDEELKLLRTVIDPLNVRKLETLGGKARKDLLREILQQEGVY